MKHEIHNDLSLKQAFEIILSTTDEKSLFSILELIYEKGTDISKTDVLAEIKGSGFKGLDDFKEKALQIILLYVKIALKDNHLGTVEKRNVQFLKLLFQIQDGDFYKKSNAIRSQLSSIITTQIALLYLDDGKIDDEEALYEVDLQELFDLSYDQFNALVDQT